MRHSERYMALPIEEREAIDRANALALECMREGFKFLESNPPMCEETRRTAKRLHDGITWNFTVHWHLGMGLEAAKNALKKYLTEDTKSI